VENTCSVTTKSRNVRKFMATINYEGPRKVLIRWKSLKRVENPFRSPVKNIWKYKHDIITRSRYHDAIVVSDWLYFISAETWEVKRLKATFASFILPLQPCCRVERSNAFLINFANKVGTNFPISRRQSHRQHKRTSGELDEYKSHLPPLLKRGPSYDEDRHEIGRERAEGAFVGSASTQVAVEPRYQHTLQ